MSDPEGAAAGEALERTFIERTFGQVQEWFTQRLTYPAKWRRAAFVADNVTYLTADELAALLDEITAIYERYGERKDSAQRPPGALPVHLYAHGHPVPPTPSGN